MKKGRISSHRFRNDKTALTGLPLRIFIMVIIAGVCLVAIVGYLVISKPDLDTIQVQDIKVDGWAQTKIWCNWTEDTNESIFKPDRGEHWYAGAQFVDPETGKKIYSHNPDPAVFDSKVTIKCIGDDDEPMADVDVVISGTGVLDSGKTNTKGTVTLSLKGCHLGPNEDIGEITVEAKYQSTFGKQKKTTSIMVLSGSEPPDQGL